MSSITLVPPPTDDHHPTNGGPASPILRVTRWSDPVADGLGVHPCSRYVELYWLGVIGPSTTWLLRRLSYGLEVHPDGFDLHLAETARSLGLGERMGKNSPFRRALQRLCTFELARPHGPGGLAVRTRIPPLPLRHVSRLPDSLQSQPPALAGRATAHRARADAPASATVGRWPGVGRTGTGPTSNASWPGGSFTRRSPSGRPRMQTARTKRPADPIGARGPTGDARMNAAIYAPSVAPWPSSSGRTPGVEPRRSPSPFASQWLLPAP